MCVVLNGIAMADETSAADAIAKHRMGLLVIKTTPGVEVRVEQQEHEFWFGTAISRRAFSGNMSADDKEKYLSVLKNNFNSAVHENALKWHYTERRMGEVSYGNADTMLEWCEDNNMRIRGHCVYWCVDKYVQPWIKRLDEPSLRENLEERAIDVMSRYKGLLAEYDVNNEMLHGNYYASRLGTSIRHDMFRWCHKADPNAVLYLNDYNILTGGNLDRYEKQISSFIEAGLPVGGIGLQGHFGKAGVDAAKVKRVLDRLAKFDLPIKITEFDINTEDEILKTQGVVGLYTTAFAHPAVDGILMWGFWEGAHWKPKAALWKKDWTPTKAALKYQNLVHNQWRTDYDGKADANGMCRVNVFFGSHKVTVGKSDPMIVRITKKDGSKTVSVGGRR